MEFWQVPASGVGAATQLSRDGSVLRFDGLPSPDGTLIAHHDKNQQLWIFDVAKKTQTKVADSAEGEFDDLQWSPDSNRGHMVVLVNQNTASDGEAFAEGFRRLGLGKVMGTRTWGGEVWLSSSNTLVDRGIATAAETGVYGPEGQWLIEGHGVDPDIVVDKLPHETHGGRDAQFDAAVRHLQDLTKTKPIPVPPPPPYPFKRWVWGMLCA